MRGLRGGIFTGNQGLRGGIVSGARDGWDPTTDGGMWISPPHWEQAPGTIDDPRIGEFQFLPFTDAEPKEMLFDALRAAGLPE